MTTLRACLVCGQPATASRCATHTLPRRGHAHAVAARQTLLEERTCWLCGRPGEPDNPLEADHVVARANGGADARHNMRAACRHCNRGRKIIA